MSKDKKLVDLSGRIKAELDQLPPLDITGTPLLAPPTTGKSAEVTPGNFPKNTDLVERLRKRMEHFPTNGTTWELLRDSIEYITALETELARKE